MDIYDRGGDEDRLLNALNKSQHIHDLVAHCDGYLGLLTSAWAEGVAIGQSHPLVELLLSEHEVHRREALERGLASLTLADALARGFARRIVQNSGMKATEATSALAELHVAGLFGRAGGTVTFIECGP